MRDFFRLTAFAVVVCTSVAANAQEAWRWARNLDEARSVAAQSNRLVLIHFSGKHCKPCRLLERDVFARPGFGQSLTADYVGVMIDAELYPATAKQFQVESWPTDVVVTPDLQFVERVASPPNIAGYTATMTQIADDFRQRNAAAATQYRQPVVTYGAVRPTVSAPPTDMSAHAAAANFAMNPATQPSTTSTAPPAAKRDRYADYYEQLSQQQVAPPMHANYPAQQASVAPASPAPRERYLDYAAAEQATAPALNHAPPNYSLPQYAAAHQAAPRSGAAQRQFAPPATTQAAAIAPPAAAQQVPRTRPAATQEQLPPGSAPLSLDGYCPVALAEQQRWLPGDVRYGAQHEGRTYLFSSVAEQQKFLQQPHRYAPVMAGNDPVFATDNGQLLAGRREHGLFVNGRIYLFVSEETLAQFERNRDRYVQSVNRTLR